MSILAVIAKERVKKFYKNKFICDWSNLPAQEEYWSMQYTADAQFYKFEGSKLLWGFQPQTPNYFFPTAEKSNQKMPPLLKKG